MEAGLALLCGHLHVDLEDGSGNFQCKSLPVLCLIVINNPDVIKLLQTLLETSALDVMPAVTNS